MGISEAKKRANKKWDADNLDRIQLVVRKGKKQIIKECAIKSGETLNAYIVNSIKQRVKSENNIEL